jgi:hypothetical protein
MFGINFQYHFLDFLAACSSGSIGDKFPIGFFTGVSDSYQLNTDFQFWGYSFSVPFINSFISSVKWAIIFRFLLTLLLSL